MGFFQDVSLHLELGYLNGFSKQLYIALANTLVHNRQVIGWSLRQHMTRYMVIDALNMAWFKRYPSNQARQIFHSDRGAHAPARTTATC